MHYPSEGSQDFILSSRAEHGASSQHAASQPNHGPSTSADPEQAGAGEQPFWEVRQAHVRHKHANSAHAGLPGPHTHVESRWVGHALDSTWLGP